VSATTSSPPVTGEAAAELERLVRSHLEETGSPVAEALLAATAGSAMSLRRNDIGIISTGRRADLTVVDAPSHEHLAYRPGMALARVLDLIERAPSG